MVVPPGTGQGDTLQLHTSYGHAVNVTVPCAVIAGQRLLLSVPLPAQGVHLTLPAAALPGMAVTFSLF